MTSSLDRVLEFSRGADFEISSNSPSGFPEELIERVEDTPRVRGVVPFVRSDVVVEGRQCLLIGTDARAAVIKGPLADEMRRRFRRFAGRPGQLLGGVFVAERLARAEGVERGDRISVWAGDRRTTAKILDVIPGYAGTQINDGMLIVGLRKVAQDLAGKPERIDSLFIAAERDADMDELRAQLNDFLGAGEILTAPGLRRKQALSEILPLRLAMSVVVVSVFVVTGFLVFNAARTAALNRSREIGVLKAVGAPRTAAVASGLVEAAVCGMIGGLVGCVAGAVAGRSLVDDVPALTLASVGVRVAYELGPGVIAMAVVAGVAGSIVSALGPAFESQRRDPIEVMRREGQDVAEDTSRSVRLTFPGIALIGSGIALSLLLPPGPGSEGLGIMLWLPGVLLLTRGLAGPVARAAGGAARRLGPAPRLAATALERSPRRFWAMTMTAGAVVFVVVTTGGIGSNVEAAARTFFASYRKIDLIVQTSPADRPPTDLVMSFDLESDLEELPGVDQVVPSRLAFVTVGGQRVYLIGLGLGSHHPIIDAAPADARREVESGRGIVISREFSERNRLRRGDRYRIVTPLASFDSKVSEIADVTFGNQGGAMAVALPVAGRLLGDPGVSRFEIYSEGKDNGTTRAAVERLTAFQEARPFVFTGAEQAGETVSVVSSYVAIFDAIEFISAAGVGLAVLSALTASVASRSREIGMLRAVGGRRRQIAGMVVVEALAAGIVGVAIGTAMGLFEHFSALSDAAAVAGLKLVYRPSAEAILAGAAAALLPSIAGSMLPARRAARMNVIDSLTFE